MVYLHVPFCRSFCTYCDFYSEIACRGRDAQQFEAFTAAVCDEISRRRDEIEATRDLNTLYIGGGTPSVLPPICLRQIVAALLSSEGVPPKTPASLRSETSRQQIDGARALWRAERKLVFRQTCPKNNFRPTARPFTEFTVEVNPEDIVEQGEAYVRELLELGVNRISMGVQSLDDGILRWMNRRHDAARACQAFRILRNAGVENISVDLIFGLSQLSAKTLSATLSELLSWGSEHISAYQLSIEEGSALGRMVREGRYHEASQEQCADQYRQICDALRAAGFVHYEISNWARPGREALHNSAYWSRHPYVGLGPGAHSFHDRTRSWNDCALTLSNPHRFAEPPMKGATPFTSVPGGDSVAATFSESLADTPSRRLMAPSLRSYANQAAEQLTDIEVREEEIMLGLRTARGIPESLLPPGVAAPLLADGRLVRLDGGRVRIPEDRWFISDDIIAELI